MAADLLETIVAATRRIVEVRQARCREADLERSIRRQPDGNAFAAALRTSTVPRVIAECKRRSPSRGILRRDYDPAALAGGYARAKAAAISVLTEPAFFDGSPQHLAAVRAEVDLPLLRKDFIVAEYQLFEAAALGADAVLLIVAALGETPLRQLIARSSALGLAVLVEVHRREELARALDAGAVVIGVNSRDLRTLSVDGSVHEEVAAALPSNVTAVAESGIRTRQDIERLERAGYHAVLVGEQLMIHDDPGQALTELRGT